MARCDSEVQSWQRVAAQDPKSAVVAAVRAGVFSALPDDVLLAIVLAVRVLPLIHCLSLGDRHVGHSQQPNTVLTFFVVTLSRIPPTLGTAS